MSMTLTCDCCGGHELVDIATGWYTIDQMNREAPLGGHMSLWPQHFCSLECIRASIEKQLNLEQPKQEPESEPVAKGSGQECGSAYGGKHYVLLVQTDMVERNSDWGPPVQFKFEKSDNFPGEVILWMRNPLPKEEEQRDY